MAADAVHVAAILLAAGLSSRMGQMKALLPWCGRSLLAYQVEQLRLAGVTDVVVVTGHEAGRVAAEAVAAGARCVHNPAYVAGRAGSLRVGAEALPDATSAIVVLNVDQPRPAALLQTLLAAYARGGQPITVPVYQGRRGHPPVISGALLPELRQVSEEHQGLRAVMLRHQEAMLGCTVDDPRCLLDLNTPESYEQARRTYGDDAIP